MKKLRMVRANSITLGEDCNMYLDNWRERNLREGTINHYRKRYVQFEKFFDIQILTFDWHCDMISQTRYVLRSKILENLKNIFSKNTFSIIDFGARPCDSLQTKSIQSALDACFLAGGGTVNIPAGIYRTGGLRLRSNTCIYLESGAILKGSNYPEDYLGYKSDKIEPIKEYEGEKRPETYL